VNVARSAGFVAVALAAAAGLSRSPASSTEPARQVAAAFQILGTDSLWPGFAPARTPLAVFDGRRTWLFGHPSPPQEYTRVDAEVFVRDGRASEVAIHESFHVFQTQRHPAWATNESGLFTYPCDSETLAALAHLELAALRQAVLQDADAAAAGWAALALRERTARFARLPAEAVEYDVTGEALGVLLDRFERGWRDSVESGRERILDVRLDAALRRRGGAMQPAAFSATELAEAHAVARDGVEEVGAARQRQRAEFLSKKGPQLSFEIESGEIDRSALTMSAGQHLLFQGVRSVRITGLPAAPEVTQSWSSRLEAEVRM
jgi:hypothetical protein